MKYLRRLMKLKRVQCLILLLILNSFLLFSKVGFTSMFGLYVGGGYPFVFDDFVETQSLGKFSGDLGLSYGFRLNNFWFECGAEYQLHESVAEYAVSGTDVLMYDTQGKEMLFHYKFDRAIDQQNFNMISVPVILGYYNSGFYIGGGPKVGFGIGLVEKSDLYYTTSATYNQYIEDFIGMPDHYYATYQESCKETLNFNFRLGALVEIGYDFLELMNSKRKNYSSLRFSVFAEYMFLNLKSDNASSLLYNIDETNPTKIQLLPFYYVKASGDSKATPFHSVIVGAKLSWMINLPHKQCKGCPNIWRKSGKFL